MGGSLNNFKYRKTTGAGCSRRDLIHRSGSLFLAIGVSQTVVFFGIHGAGHFIG